MHKIPVLWKLYTQAEVKNTLNVNFNKEWAESDKKQLEWKE